MQNSLRHILRPALASALLLALAACAGCASNGPEAGNSTPELAVVVFATEDPNAATPTSLPNPTEVVIPTPSPATGASAGVGVGDQAPAQTDNVVLQSSLDFNSYVANRPPDVNPLTGLKVDDPAILQRRPLMVRVGNDPGARPQVALNEADVVYEEITEWWVTRFTAIYLSRDPDMIAPVRSARLINLQLTPQYQGVLANSGGSDGVRWELSQTDIINMDEFFIPQPYFYRPNEGWQTRLAVDATAARDYLNGEGIDRNVNLRGFLFSSNIDATSLPPNVLSDAKTVIVPFPQRTSKATWQFDSGSGRYLRLTTDAPHLGFDGQQLAANNIIIYFADHQPTEIVEDSNGATSIRIIINGRGAAWLLRDGKILKGNWETDGQHTPKFIFDNGQPMPLKPGNTWVQVVPLEYFINVDGVEMSSLPGADSTGGSDSDETAAPSATEVLPTPTFTPIGARPQATPGGQ